MRALNQSVLNSTLYLINLGKLTQKIFELEFFEKPNFVRKWNRNYPLSIKWRQITGLEAAKKPALKTTVPLSKPSVP